MTDEANTRDYIFAALLAATCGIADAVGYVGHGIFAANMTGNTVLVGLAVASADWLLAGERAITLVTFFVGAVVGRRLVAAKVRFWVPLLLEAVLIGIAALVDPGAMLPLWTIALAMGVQATAFARFPGIAISTIVVTSSIAHLAERAHDRVLGRPTETAAPTRPSGGLLALVWIAYGVGAVLAGLLLQAVRFPLVVPAALLLALTAVALRR